MNLYEFINYRTYCPLCAVPLITGFISERKQTVKNIDNKIAITLELKSLIKGQKIYNCIYLFDLYNNSFSIEFSDSNKTIISDSSPLFLINRFKEFNENVQLFKFYRSCPFCHHYSYGSCYFSLNFKECSITPFEVSYEQIILSKNYQDGYRHFRITNLFLKNKSILYFWNSKETLSGLWVETSATPWSTLTLPIIPITSEEKLLQRLGMIVTFS